MDFINRTFLLISISLAAFGCKEGLPEKGDGFSLQAGDLLFQDLDCGPLCDAIEEVTTGFERANFSHVGVVAETDRGNLVVIEAVSGGVEVAPLRTFLGRSSDAKGRPKVVVGRLKEPYRHLIPSALREAFVLKGKPYDRAFAIDNDAFYCSELIYEIFLRANQNNPIFALQPMTFKDPETGKTLSAWEEYFSELGVRIPEGQLGINPGGISRSPVLTVVYEYGAPSRKPLS